MVRRGQGRDQGRGQHTGGQIPIGQHSGGQTAGEDNSSVGTSALAARLPTTHPVQEALFDDGSAPVPDETVGYRGTLACSAAGITYRQLDYWARTKLVEPSIRTASGSGTQRLYSFTDILVLKVVKRLLDTGVSLPNIRVAVEHLRARGAEHGVERLAELTLFSDGATVYECTSPEEVVDLVAGGQGVFGIAVNGALRELSGSLAELPAERADGEPTHGDDELGRRRRARSAG
jgi:DNA-binding transcriptional MerR regulator